MWWTTERARFARGSAVCATLLLAASGCGPGEAWIRDDPDGGIAKPGPTSPSATSGREALPGETSTVAWPYSRPRLPWTPTDVPPPDVPLVPSVKQLVAFDMGSGTVPVWVDRPLDVVDPGVTRAIIMVHGSSRDSEAAIDRTMEFTPPEWQGRVAIVAPFFQEEADAANGELWWDDDWKEGGDSGGVSSFAVADALVRTLRAGSFPYLQYIVVAGHSAGGQFSQRYAAFAGVDASLMKFVPANPSSYVYLDGTRWDDTGWITPSDGCTGYNDYKYGLDGLYAYAADRGPDFARAHLPARWVEVLAGTLDITPEHGFDDSCEGFWEGPTRYDRAHIYFDYMNAFHAPQQLSVTDVPGADHDADLMFGSEQGVAALFFE
jgi:hypothetical protein